MPAGGQERPCGIVGAMTRSAGDAWLSQEDWKTLQSYNDDSLRQWANRLTQRSGNGTIYNYDGTTTMLGGNMSRSITKRVLDRFQPSMRPEELDLTQYH